MTHFTVAIDGPAAAGKGTIARAIADRYSIPYLDTGILYRAVARKFLDLGAKPSDAEAERIAMRLVPDDLRDDRLRSPEVSETSSQIASMPAVRRALKGYQEAFARQPGGAVLDGRDIGTVICPEAEVKLFVTASRVVRARRRYRELQAAGTTVSEAAIQREIDARDQRDINRPHCALRPHDDAVLLDTSELTIDQAVARAVSAIEQQMRAIQLPGAAKLPGDILQQETDLRKQPHGRKNRIQEQSFT